jgi:tetratricopeptide (TPR) repeat protein
VRYDRDNVSNTSVSLLIQSESIATDLDFRDKDLKSDNWLDVAKFSSIAFTSRAAKKTNEGLDLVGDLSIKGISKEVILHMAPASGVLKDGRGDLQVIFTGTTTIDRTQFGVEGKNWSAVKEGITAVEKDILIEFSILGKKYQASNFANRVRNAQSSAGKLYKIITDQGVQVGIDEFKKMLSNKSVSMPALDNVGYMLMLEGKYSDAIAVYEANKEAFPESADVYYSIGEFYILQGDKMKAKSFFQEVLKRDTNYTRATEYLRHL